LSAARVLWGQIIVVFLIVLIAVWSATQWTAWRLALAAARVPLVRTFETAGLSAAGSLLVWYFYDAYAPHVFLEGGAIAASGGLIAIVVVIFMSIWQAREAKDVRTFGSARWAEREEIEVAGLGLTAGFRARHGQNYYVVDRLFAAVELRLGDKDLQRVSASSAPMVGRREGRRYFLGGVTDDGCS
jgi:type IV secretion system protein VirD4